MPWFRVDDQLAFHSKSLAAGNSALGLWVRAGAWSSAMLTDGHIPAELIGVSGLGTPVQAKRLCDAGLWLPTDTGYLFHDWGDFQPLRAEVERRRKDGGERLRAWRATQRGENVHLLKPKEGPDVDHP